MLVPNDHIAPKETSQALQAVGVYQDLDGYKRKQVTILVDKYKQSSRIMTNSGTLRHLDQQSKNCIIWRPLDHVLPYTIFSKLDG